MVCNRCGCQLDAQDKYCPDCGAIVGSGTGNTTQRNYSPYDTGYNNGYNQIPLNQRPITQNQPPITETLPKKRTPVALIMATIVAVILCLLVIVLMVRKSGERDSSSEAPDTPVATTASDNAVTVATTESKSEEVEVVTPVPASFEKGSTGDLSGLTAISLSESQVQGSSHISKDKYRKDNTNTYEAYKAMDGNNNTSWQFDCNNLPGKLTALINGRKNMQAISFKIGNWNEDKPEKGRNYRFDQNCRPRHMKITLFAGNEKQEFECYFEDSKTEQVYVFTSPIPADRVVFEIDDYIHGNESSVDDICLAEVTLYE